MGVVPAFDVVEDGGSSVSTGFEGGSFDEFTLEGSEEALTERVVVAVTDGAHGGSYVFFEAPFAEREGCVLTAVIGVVDDVGWFSLFESHTESMEHEFCAQMVLHTPSDDLPAPDVDDGGKVEEALGCWDIGDISDPQLVGPIGFESAVNEIRGGAGGVIPRSPPVVD